MTQSRIVTAIVAMNAERVIGKDGALPWHYSEDLKRFKRLTLNATVIMGRKTWESIGGKALPERRNIVISSSEVKNVECYSSIEQALAQTQGQVWIIGGGQLYRCAMPYCDAVDVTWVKDDVKGKNLARFAELDPHIWRAGKLSTNENDARLKHQLFTRIKPHTC